MSAAALLKHDTTMQAERLHRYMTPSGFFRASAFFADVAAIAKQALGATNVDGLSWPSAALHTANGPNSGTDAPAVRVERKENS